MRRERPFVPIPYWENITNLYGVIDITFRSMLPMLDDARISNNNAMIGNITIDISVGCDQHIISHCDVTYNCSIYANPHFVSDLRCSLAGASILLADGHTLVNIAIISNHCPWIDRYVVYVSKIQTFSNIRLAGYLETSLSCSREKTKRYQYFSSALLQV